MVQPIADRFAIITDLEPVEAHLGSSLRRSPAPPTSQQLATALADSICPGVGKLPPALRLPGRWALERAA